MEGKGNFGFVRLQLPPESVTRVVDYIRRSNIREVQEDAPEDKVCPMVSDRNPLGMAANEIYPCLTYTLLFSSFPWTT